MNDSHDSRSPSNIGSTLVAFALGAAVGGGLALLLAPESGSKTRERLASTARRWGKNAGETMEHARDAVTDLGIDAKSAIKAGQEAFAQDRVAREARSERWMASDATPRTRKSQERSGEEAAS
jgi:gas vesicle protein